MAKPKLKQFKDGLGYRSKAFWTYLCKECPEFATLTEREQNYMASYLWAASTSRLAHNSGEEGVIPFHWAAKARHFGSARRFNEINEGLGWFELKLKAKVGKSAEGWTMKDKAKNLANNYFDQSAQYSLHGLEPEDKGLVNPDGSPYRLPADAIRSRTATGKTSRFKRKQIQAAIEIDGDNLHAFHHAAQAWLNGETAPPAFQWAHNKWDAMRDGRGPNSGIEKATARAVLARDQASVILDLAKRSGVPGYVIPTTYRESPAGRLYAEGSANLQRCVGEVRQAALKGCYDVDIENCHWSLLSQMAARIGITTPNVSHYLAHKKATRAELASAAGISLEDAKFVLLAMIYGATLARSPRQHTHAIEERIGKDAADRLRNFKVVKDLHRDVKTARDAIIQDYTDRTKKSGVLVNDAGREIGVKAEAREKLAHILQGAESVAMQSMISVLHASIALLQHDGLTVYGKSNLEHLEGKLKADTGLNILSHHYRGEESQRFTSFA